jgi:hypothetical protein
VPKAKTKEKTTLSCFVKLPLCNLICTFGLHFFVLFWPCASPIVVGSTEIFVNVC